MESSPFSTISELRRRPSENEAKSEPSGPSSANSLRLRRLSSISLIPMSLIGLLIAYLVLLRASEGSSCCQTQDHPNILHEKFPNNATGNLNATVAIIPIALDQARQFIPSQYRILEHAYRSLLPDFPAGMYPLVIQAGHDHDIRFMEFSIPDFSVGTAHSPVHGCLLTWSRESDSSSPSSTSSATGTRPSAGHPSR